MILDKIAAYTRLRIEEAKKELSPDEIRRLALSCKTDTGFPFEKVLKEPGIHYICEVKKASPSKGVIAEDFPYLKIAEEYEKAGASAISCLTEPKYFMGKNVYLKEITGKVKIPVLRKDFTVDEYMIYEAKLLGASAVLLICAILDTETVRDYIHICDELGLSALVEVHDEKEMRSAIEAGGENHRSKQPESERLYRRYRKQCPPQKISSAGCIVCGGKWNSKCREYQESQRSRCEWSADR